MAISLRGKTALITGASMRIGRAIALALADEGVNIIVHYHQSTDEASALCHEVKERGVLAWVVAADLTDPDAAEMLLPRALAEAGALDILVNNASVFPPSRLGEVTFADLQRNMAVNAWAPFVLSRAFALLVGRGAIVNLLDTRVTGYDWAHVAYLVSKQALAEFTRLTAVEYAPEITVNAVAPGLIIPPPGEGVEYLERRIDTVPLKRHGDPADIADAVVFLARARFITGEVIFVDGGRHLLEYGHGSHPH